MRLIWLAVVFTLGPFLAPLGAEEQQAGRMPRIGHLSTAAGFGPREEAFRLGLRELDYIEGKNVVVVWRFAEGHEDRLAPLAAELVRLNVDIIVTDGAAVTRAAKSATRTIPIIMKNDGDPVASGHVASLARPGGNITGLTSLVTGLSAKRLEVLTEVIPGVSRVALVWNPTNPQSVTVFKETQAAAQTLGVQLQSHEVRDPRDFDAAFQATTKARARAVTIVSDSVMFAHRAQILELAAKQKLPTMHPQRQWVEDGGLISYGPNFPDLSRRAATYVDKILKGAKPGDLPVEQPTKFELVINLKTAKALGLTIPQSLLIRADEVIK
jgi:putative ABC transport system substrate-binding protein